MTPSARTTASVAARKFGAWMRRSASTSGTSKKESNTASVIGIRTLRPKYSPAMTTTLVASVRMLEVPGVCAGAIGAGRRSKGRRCTGMARTLGRGTS